MRCYNNPMKPPGPNNPFPATERYRCTRRGRSRLPECSMSKTAEGILPKITQPQTRLDEPERLLTPLGPQRSDLSTANRPPGQTQPGEAPRKAAVLAGGGRIPRCGSRFAEMPHDSPSRLPGSLMHRRMTGYDNIPLAPLTYGSQDRTNRRIRSTDGTRTSKPADPEAAARRPAQGLGRIHRGRRQPAWLPMPLRVGRAATGGRPESTCPPLPHSPGGWQRYRRVGRATIRLTGDDESGQIEPDIASDSIDFQGEKAKRE